VEAEKMEFVAINGNYKTVPKAGRRSLAPPPLYTREYEERDAAFSHF